MFASYVIQMHIQLYFGLVVNMACSGGNLEQFCVCVCVLPSLAPCMQYLKPEWILSQG